MRLDVRAFSPNCDEDLGPKAPNIRDLYKGPEAPYSVVFTPGFGLYYKGLRPL